MMKFKSSSARMKFKFKSELRARVKFKARGVYKSCAPKCICLAHTATYRKRLPARTSSSAKILDAFLHRLIKHHRRLDCKFKLLKNSGEAKFKILPHKRKRIKAPRSVPLGRFEAPPAYQACFFALRNRPK